MGEDASPTSHVSGILGVVNYLFDKGLINQGWKYLLIAENICLQQHYYDILNTIDLLQFEKSHLNTTLKTNEILSKYTQNQKFLQEEEKLQIAKSLIKERINKEKNDRYSNKL